MRFAHENCTFAPSQIESIMIKCLESFRNYDLRKFNVKNLEIYFSVAFPTMQISVNFIHRKRINFSNQLNSENYERASEIDIVQESRKFEFNCKCMN